MTEIAKVDLTNLNDDAVVSERSSGVALRDRAFRELYEREFDFVWRNLARLGVRDSDLEDRAQEVFIIAHRKLDLFEDRGSGPRAWLFQIALRIASNARRESRRRPATPDLEAIELVASGDDASRYTFQRDATDQLDALLQQMDFDRRTVLILHEIEEMSAAEIADVLAVPLNTVYSRLRVAKQEFERLHLRETRRTAFPRLEVVR